MGSRKRRAEPEEDDLGAPEWMVTFSDCMTLLLTFFVLLISFSSFDDKLFQRMESAFAEGLSSISPWTKYSEESMLLKPRIHYEQTLEKGSEAPTVDGRYETNPSENLDFMDFENQKVFLLPSSEMFLGRGAHLSSSGQQLLRDMAFFLQASVNRVVVTEHATKTENDDESLGLERAWEIIRFLTVEGGLEHSRFCMSCAGVTDAKSVKSSGLFSSSATNDRLIEIVILERSVYR